jgi:hypothetical protein
MKRFVTAAALAVVLSFAFAETANAQIVYGYSAPRGAGIVSGGTYLSPGLQQGYNSYYSPYSGMMMSQVYGRNFLGQAYGQTYAYNPWTGLNYNSGFYQPNYWVNPYGGYSWSTLRRWGW